jgi:hypothetical protein
MMKSSGGLQAFVILLLLFTGCILFLNRSYIGPTIKDMRISIARDVPVQMPKSVIIEPMKLPAEPRPEPTQEPTPMPIRTLEPSQVQQDKIPTRLYQEGWYVSFCSPDNMTKKGVIHHFSFDDHYNNWIYDISTAEVRAYAGISQNNIINTTAESNLFIESPCNYDGPVPEEPTPELQADELTISAPVLVDSRSSLVRLRTDLEDIRKAGTFSAELWVTQVSSNAVSNDYSTQSLIIHIEPCVQEHLVVQETDECGLSQAGILTNRGEVRWFVFSYLPIECLYGTEAWHDIQGEVRGCLGEPEDVVSLHTWQRVQMTREAERGYWYVSIGKPSDIGPWPVARISSDSREIDYAGLFVTETGSTPDVEAGAWFKKPKFRSTSHLCQDWPASDKEDTSNNFNSASVSIPHCDAYGIIDVVTQDGGEFYIGAKIPQVREYQCSVERIW